MRKSVYFILLLLLVGLVGCTNDDNDVSQQEIAVNFSNSEQSIDQSDASREVTVTLSRKAEVAIDVAISVSGSDLVYGTDYTTDVAVNNGVLTLTVPAGTTSASFLVTKGSDALFDGDESLQFSIASLSVSNGVVIGEKKHSSLLFGTILSSGETLTLEGKSGSVAYANSVYVDFSNNNQSVIDRTSWALGFSSGSDFRVVLNPAYGTTAAASNKTELADVTLDDANNAINLAASIVTGEALSSTVVDSYNGALSGTVFAEVSATDSENKVYFVATEDDKSSRDHWYKVKVTRSVDGYKVQYGKVTDTTFKTIDVKKNSAYNLSFLSLKNNSVVNVEPQAKKWDIMWSYYVGPTYLSATVIMPYFMQDVVLINNLAGAQAVEVMVSAISYENFNTTNLASLTFSSDRNVIGSSWRSIPSGAPSGGATTGGVYADRFYVVKDPNGNYYKLRFLKMGLNNDGTERGRPVIQYALVK
jgi:hypothetical protein